MPINTSPSDSITDIKSAKLPSDSNFQRTIKDLLWTDHYVKCLYVYDVIKFPNLWGRYKHASIIDEKILPQILQLICGRGQI
jgi:hypothetical protein